MILAKTQSNGNQIFDTNEDKAVAKLFAALQNKTVNSEKI
jgi:hypothetical protein